MAICDVSAPPGWEINPSAKGQRAPLVALGLVGLALSVLSLLRARGLVVGEWQAIPTVTRGGWILHEARVPSPELDVVGFLLVVLTSALGSESRWRTSRGWTLASGLLVLALGLSAATRWTTQYAVTGATSVAFFLTTAVALALVPLASDEVYAALTRGRSPRGSASLPGGFGRRVTHASPYLGAGGAILVGLWLLASPYDPSPESLHTHLAGGAVVTIGALSLARVAHGIRWVNAGLALVMLVSPLYFGYSLRGALLLVIAGLMLLAATIAFDEPARELAKR